MQRRHWLSSGLLLLIGLIFGFKALSVLSGWDGYTRHHRLLASEIAEFPAPVRLRAIGTTNTISFQSHTSFELLRLADPYWYEKSGQPELEFGHRYGARSFEIVSVLFSIIALVPLGFLIKKRIR